MYGYLYMQQKCDESALCVQQIDVAKGKNSGLVRTSFLKLF